MANVHYGNIGDIWKHLSLAEILAIEAPSVYWESHAGSSHYALTHTPERDFGIFTFARAASQSQRLNTAVYTQLLKGYERNGQLQLYPGSPLLAMRVLQPHHATFVFCDIDRDIVSPSKAFASWDCPTRICTSSNEVPGNEPLASLLLNPSHDVLPSQQFF